MEKKNLTEEKEVLAALYGAKAFVKIKQWLDVGKMAICFVNLKDTSKYINCYMEAEEFGALFMADIKNGSLFRKIQEEKSKTIASGKQFSNSIWSSPIGGNATANNGEPVSRYFTISPGLKTEIVLTAIQMPAKISDTGAFIAIEHAQPLIKLSIGCSYNDLRILQYKWSFLEHDYMQRKYTLSNMRSEYQKTQSEQNMADQSNSITAPVSQGSEKPDETSAPAENVSAPPSYSTLTFKSTSPLKPLKNNPNNYALLAKNKNEEKTIIFLSEKIAKMDEKKWKQFYDLVNQKGVTFKASFMIKDSKYYFKEFIS